MKNQKSVQQSFKGCVLKADNHAHRIRELLDKVSNSTWETESDVELQSLRDEVAMLSKYIHELNAYHNVLYTE